jgi:hypothetical protein
MSGTTAIISLQDLLSADKWKADSFVFRKSLHASAYPMAVLSSLLEERSEFLTPGEFPEHAFSYLGLEHVAPNTGDLVGFSPKKGVEVKSRSKVFREGDILYGRLRPYLNKVYVATGSVMEGICSGEFYVLVPDMGKVRPEFLRELLASRFVRDGIAGLHTGSALPRLQLHDLLRLEVPVPPLQVQDEIVQVLCALALERERARVVLGELPARVEEELRAALTEGRRFDTASAVAHHDLPAYRCELPADYKLARGRRRGAIKQLPFGG